MQQDDLILVNLFSHQIQFSIFCKSKNTSDSGVEVINMHKMKTQKYKSLKYALKSCRGLCSSPPLRIWAGPGPPGHLPGTQVQSPRAPFKV